MARNLGATLSLKEGNFFTNIKSAVSATDNLKKKLGGTTSTLKNQSSQVNSLGSNLKSLAGKVAGVVAAYAGMQQIVSFTKDCIEAANTQTAAEQRLQQTMSNVKGTTQEQINSVKAYASTLQGLTTVGDEVAIHGASQLATFQLQSDTIKTLMPAMEDLAVAQYGVSVSSEQMQGMANLVGKVMSGSVSALTRYGVVMNDTQQKILKSGTESQKAAMLVEVLKQNFGGLAEAMADTPEGRIQQLKNAWGDVQEVIGAKLYPVITKTLGWVAEKVPTLQNVITSAVEGCQPVFDAFTDYVLPAVDNLFNAFKNIGSAISDAFGEQASGGISNLVTTVLPGLINVLSVAGNGIAGVIRHWQLFAPIIGTVVGAIMLYKGAVVACNVVEGIRNGLTTIAAAVTGTEAAAFAPLTTMTIAQTAATGALSMAQSALNAVFIASPIGWIVLAIGAVVAIFAVLWNKCEGFRNFWIGLWDKVKSAVKTAWDFLKPIFEGIKNAFSAVGNYLSGIWNGVKEQIAPVLDAMKSTVSEKLSNIKNAYTEHGGGLKGVAFAAMEGVKSAYTAGFTFIDNLTGGKLSAVVGKISEKLAPVKEVFTEIFGKIKPILTNVITFFSNSFENVKTVVVNIFNGIKTNIVEFVNKIKQPLTNIVNGVKTIFGGIKTIIVNVFGFIVGIMTLNTDKIKTSLTGIVSGIGSIFEGAKTIIVNWLTIVGQFFLTAFENIKTVVVNVIEGVKTQFGIVRDFIAGVFETVKTNVLSIFDSIKNGIVEKITAAVDTVKNVFTKISDTVSSVWDKIKSLLKAPKIVQTGTVTVMGVDTPIPKFGLDWNAKGGIMTRPTAFGFANGKIQMGGEAGAEAILPLSAFWRNLQAYTENSQKKSQGNNDININVTINAGNANEEEMAARFINIVVPEIKRQYAIL